MAVTTMLKKLKMRNIETIYEVIKKGGYPSLTGMAISVQQSVEIKNLLHKSDDKGKADAYFSNVVEPRIIK